jgi:L-rhamnose mutarotase
MIVTCAIVSQQQIDFDDSPCEYVSTTVDRHNQNLLILFYSFDAELDSIFFDQDHTLFAVFTYVGENFELDQAKMKANLKVREWWQMTDAMQVWQFSTQSREDPNPKKKFAKVLMVSRQV